MVSFAASVKTRAIEEAAGIEIAVIRAMPNTPSALGAGAAGLCRGRFVKPEQMELAQRIFETVGRTVVVDEKHMDAVTGLSARARRTSTSSSRRWLKRASRSACPATPRRNSPRKPSTVQAKWCSKPAIIRRCSKMK